MSSHDKPVGKNGSARPTQVRGSGPSGRAGSSLSEIGKNGLSSTLPLNSRQILLIGLAAAPILAAFVWSYLPTLADVVHQWNTQSDYSHGYFVVPVALFLLWVRRDSFPGWSGRIVWSGLILFAASLALRWLGGYYFLGSVDAWSMVVWVAGVVCVLAGWRVLLWASPAIVFLFFMIPLPYSGERMLSVPLQGVATTFSTVGLRFLGQPALAEGHTILLGDARLEVVDACSGLRIFVGILALAYAYLVIVRRPVWQKAIVALSVIPVTLIANSTRIVVTGLLSQYFSSEAAHTFTHDLAGWFMIPFAAGLFALVLWYLNRAFVAEETLAPESLLKSGRPPRVAPRKSHVKSGAKAIPSASRPKAVRTRESTSREAAKSASARSESGSTGAEEPADVALRSTP